MNYSWNVSVMTLNIHSVFVYQSNRVAIKRAAKELFAVVIIASHKSRSNRTNQYFSVKIKFSCKTKNMK